ncbi:zf-HC2 domain-containing protein [Ignavibacterium sp.]|uniref:zf-HC2 domain-containing protein n=1 Tax=Ignavibacterium sp. TaxID=2651167 RepID=UPI002637D1DA|nr:zf-HC2 domain-containing protein [Ignavibacterium sp.]
MKNFLEEYSMLLNNSREHLSNQAISTYLNLREVLSEKEQAFVENHLKSCSECRIKYEKIISEDKEMDEIFSENTSEISEHSSIKNFQIIKLFKYSAVALISIALGLSFYYILVVKDDLKIVQKVDRKFEIDSLSNIQKVDSNKTPEIAFNEKTEVKRQWNNFDKEVFATNAVLENFINRNTRSNLNYEIISPANGDTVKSPITFNWKQIKQSKSNTIVIVDNKNRTVYQKTIIGSEIKVNQKFNRGLYYWKLLSDDKLELVGKFFIR